MKFWAALGVALLAFGLALAALVIATGGLPDKGTSPPGAIAIPNVVGMPIAFAGSTLHRSGLNVATHYSVGNPAFSGTVVGEYPLAGTRVNYGALVVVTVSRR